MDSGSRIALVTGGGGGIGRGVALALARAGWSLVVAGRREEPLRETAAAAPDPGRCTVVRADVSDPADVGALFESVRDRHGRLDLLFNNAGTFGPSVPVDEIGLEDWRRVIDVNLTGAFLCAQAAFRLMREQSPPGGRIINNGSISAHVPRPHAAAYTASKHAVTGLTRALALEGRALGIACGQIDVGNAATEMTGAMGSGVLQADGSVRPEARMDAGHVADAVVYIAGLPLEANVPFMTVMATGMPYVGRG